MKIAGSIYQLPREIKILIVFFIAMLSIGFYGGITFVKETTNSNPKGIEERYLGNETDDFATTMKFKKSKSEVLTMVHNHILSLSVIFFLISLIVATTDIHEKLKLFLMIEPFLSILLTFGGIYLLWTGVLWFKYIIMLSGILMTFSFTLSVLVILKSVFTKKGIYPN